MKELVWPKHRPATDGYNQVCEPSSVLIRQAVIMAGGKGRLLPYSALFPKPLMPLGDMPILELLLRRMKAVGVQEVILAVNHLRQSD
jgi:UTP-glucose-1-phosphate uridylyltransferase